MRLVTVATCTLDQWAMDFSGNLDRIRASIRRAKSAGARIRLGPELEITGYSCEDHFLEPDTYAHAWEVLAELLKGNDTNNLLCDFGMPVMHHNVYYNCRVVVLNRRIVLIRPKMILANDGNYREMRYFAPWPQARALEEHHLPRVVRAVTGQETAPFGFACIATHDTVLAPESCEELFAANSPHVALGLDGCEIFLNGSGSHHQLRKLNTRIDLICGATAKQGGVYLYANQQGCDGNRLYYDGSSMVAVNGEIVARGTQFSVRDVEVVTATIDLGQVRSFRGQIPSRANQGARADPVPRISVDFTVSDAVLRASARPPTRPIKVRYHSPEEEIALGPACWLWDYLRRSKAGGFFLPLSGGADSSSTAAIVGSMCQLVVREIKSGRNPTILADLRAVVRDDEYVPVDAKDMASRIFFTAYMGTEHNSSSETRDRAAKLAGEVGANHTGMVIDVVVNALVSLIAMYIGKAPQYKVHGGSETENLALQNVQARSRMVIAYMMAQLLLWSKGRPGSLLVLGSANVDEALRGYMTKYDCSSADLNPIGGISKLDLRRFMLWGAKNLGYPTLAEVAEAPPTAELEPITSDHVQLDEEDMGMSYEELGRFGRLRKLARAGPVSMFRSLYFEWRSTLAPSEVAAKVKRFFFYYSLNRHKTTVLTPSYHAENYSPEDNRFDLRQFLYNVRWPWQFQRIDEMVAELEKGKGVKGDDDDDDSGSGGATASDAGSSAGREGRKKPRRRAHRK